MGHSVGVGILFNWSGKEDIIFADIYYLLITFMFLTYKLPNVFCLVIFVFSIDVYLTYNVLLITAV